MTKTSFGESEQLLCKDSVAYMYIIEDLCMQTGSLYFLSQQNQKHSCFISEKIAL